MRRLLTYATVLALAAVACDFEPLDDPGLGDLGLTTIVYAADGTILAQWHAEEDRALVTFDQLPEHLINAVVAIEDERYWTHPGVDLRAIARSLAANLDAETVVQGGSTITQQYLKNVVLTPKATVDRKIEEATLALRLEENLTKEEILERYLNTVYFGDGAYGIASAAAHFFGKSVSDLTLAESALLAGLIQSPSYTDPMRKSEAAIERRAVVLDKLADLGWISVQESEIAKTAPLEVVNATESETVRFPYFVEEVKQRLLDEPALGATATDRYNALFRGGLRIYTTIDPTMQQAAEAAVVSVLPEGGPAAAVVAIEPRTGYVRVLVGGADFYDPNDPVAKFNLATQGRRQTGSAFKPFALAAALEEGFSLDSVFRGGSSIVVQTDAGPWVVENYANSTFPNLTLLEATVFSVNVIYAQVVHAVGPEKVVEAANAAGIQTDLLPYHSIVLGAQEVSPLEMASAYGTFAAEGVNVSPIFVTAIETSSGINLYSPVPVVTQAFDRDVTSEVTAALAEVVRRGTGVRARIGRPVAGKTGTSQQHSDAWFVGYTPELSAAVWVGYPEGQIPMERPKTSFSVTGGSWPAQIWSQFASAALTGTGFSVLAGPDLEGNVRVAIDLSTGFLAGPLCPRAHVTEIVLPAGEAPTVVCPIHNPTGVVQVGSVPVPDVIGEDYRIAVGTLQDAGFFIAVEFLEAGTLAPGTIFNQEPSPGFPAQLGSTIRISVAGPNPSAVVPSLLGFPMDQARARLSELGITSIVIVQEEANPDDARHRSGLVWKQQPAGGSDTSETVTLWVNP